MKKTHDLAVKTGSYQKDGETKNRYLNIGSIMENDNGSFILMERTFNPAGLANPDDKSSIIVSMFAVKTESQNNSASGLGKEVNLKPEDNPFSDGDDIPF